MGWILKEIAELQLLQCDKGALVKFLRKEVAALESIKFNQRSIAIKDIHWQQVAVFLVFYERCDGEVR